MDEPVWENHHHRSSFLPNSNSIELDFVSFITSDIVENTQSPVLLQDVDSKGNLCNVTQTIPIDILMKIGIVEHVHIG